MKFKWLLVVFTCVAVQAFAAEQQVKTVEAPKATQKSSASLVGSWEFVSGRYTTTGKPPIEVKSPELRALKVITGTHFSYVTEKGDGTFYVAGAGSCKLEQDKYTETLDYSSVATMKKKSYTFKYRIENDLWYMEGKEDDSYTEEVWRRVP